MLGNSRTRALLLLLATFTAGGVAGAAIARSWPGRAEVKQSASEQDDARIPTPLTWLGLSDSETVKLRAVARRWRPKASAELREMRRQVAELENGMFAEMLCVLS